jgi:hypothetical protein
VNSIQGCCDAALFSQPLTVPKDLLASFAIMSPSRVSAPAPARPLRGNDATRRSAGFAVADSAEGGGPMAASAAPLGLSTLLAVQAGSERAADHGCGGTAAGLPTLGAALDGLKGLQLALLRGGDVPVEELTRLAGLAERLDGAGGEAAALGRAISLRLRVELARRAAPDGA